PERTDAEESCQKRSEGAERGDEKKPGGRVDECDEEGGRDRASRDYGRGRRDECQRRHGAGRDGQEPAAGEQPAATQRPTIPSTGLLAVAYIFRGIRPARQARRPARTASFIDSAIATGSCAPAIAVFIKTPSAPSSMANVAS